MVAIIKTGYSVARSFRYNENKVEQGAAECIMAGHYPCEPDELSANQRLNMLLKLTAMNENVRRNSIHISLNFHPSDTLSKNQLKEIALRYMDGIGFAAQPFLVYQHHDAAHPHLHVVSTMVRADGKAIPTQNNAKNQSEQIRKQIERQYGLRPAKQNIYQRQALTAKRVTYGDSATMRSITQVLDSVLADYKYTSLSELNAILGQYNVMAIAAAGASGLRYCVLDKNGRKTGVAIKASAFHNKPTLAYLKKRFVINHIERRRHSQRLTTAINFALLKAVTADQLLQTLQKQGIKMVLASMGSSSKRELIYIDFQSKCAFSGADLGERYGEAMLQQRLRQQDIHADQKTDLQLSAALKDSNAHQSVIYQKDNSQKQQPVVIAAPPVDPDFLRILFGPVSQSEPVPAPLKRSKKKRRKKLSQQL